MENMILTGDCFDKLDDIQDSSVDLIYVDPPFFTQKVHKLRTRDNHIEYSFPDVWESIEKYKKFIELRISKCKDKLRLTGSIFFHCNTDASHHIRHILDRVFGADMFRSEIIWAYRRWSRTQQTLLPGHQTIFFYSKTKKYKYHTLLEPYSLTTNIEQILQRRKRDKFGRVVYEKNNLGDAILSGKKPGVPISDVWNIPLLNPKARERTGYPTQKPILLLDRIISLSTDIDDVVLDPFCGSGTTLVSAKLLNRKYIGIDNNPDAVNLASKRIMTPFRTNSKLEQGGFGTSGLADNDIIKFLHGINIVPVYRNKGIDALLLLDSIECPVFIRVQRQDEPISVAGNLLAKAGRLKKSAILILIITQDVGCLDATDNLPPTVRAIFSTNILLKQLLHRICKC